MENNTLGENIKKLRTEKKFTVEELAIRVKINYIDLIKIENNISRHPSLHTVAKIAKEFGVPVDRLGVSSAEVIDYYLCHY